LKSVNHCSVHDFKCKVNPMGTCVIRNPGKTETITYQKHSICNQLCSTKLNITSDQYPSFQVSEQPTTVTRSAGGTSPQRYLPNAKLTKMVWQFCFGCDERVVSSLKHYCCKCDRPMCVPVNVEQPTRVWAPGEWETERMKRRMERVESWLWSCAI
jgi:hypothetical protein